MSSAYLGRNATRRLHFHTSQLPVSSSHQSAHRSQPGAPGQRNKAFSTQLSGFMAPTNALACRTFTSKDWMVGTFGINEMGGQSMNATNFEQPTDDWYFITDCDFNQYRGIVSSLISSRGYFELSSLDERFPSVWPSWEFLSAYCINELLTTDSHTGYRSLSLVRTFFADSALQQFLESSGGVFDWRHPTHPEDFCCYTSDKKLWLASISHESILWLSPVLTASSVLELFPNKITPASAG